MVDQKFLREFSVFLFVFLCTESQRNLSEGSTTSVLQSSSSLASQSQSKSSSASSSSSCFCYHTTAGFSNSSSTSFSVSPTSSSTVNETSTSTSPASSSSANELACICSTPWSSHFSSSSSASLSASSSSTSSNSATPASTAPPSTAAGIASTTSTAPSSTSAGITSTTATTPSIALPGSASVTTTTPSNTSAGITSTTATTPSSAPAGITSATATTPSIALPGSASVTTTTPSITLPGSASVTTTTPSITLAGITSTTATTPSSASAGIASATATTPSIALPGSASVTSTTPSITLAGITSTTATTPGSALAGITSTTATTPSITLAGITSTTATTPSSALAGSASTPLTAPDSTSAGIASTTSTAPSSLSAGSASTTATAPSSASAGIASTTLTAPSSASAGSTSAAATAPSRSVSMSTPMSQSVESSVNVSPSSTPGTDSSSVSSDSIQPTTTSSMPLSSSVATDIDECASSPCQNNGTCVDGPNSFNCTCPVGYLGDTCSFEDPCLRNPCLNNGTCNVDAPNNYTFFCVCPIPKAYTGKDCGTPVQCFWDIMYPYGKEQGDLEIAAEDVKNVFCPTVTIDSGLYFFDNQFYEVYICANGMLSFVQDYFLNTPIPTYRTDEFQFDWVMLAPFWSKIDSELSFCSSPGDCYFNYTNRSSVFYQVYTDASQTLKATHVLGNASEQVRSNQPEGFRNFSAKWVMVVTWLRLRPDDPILEEGITNTFQVVLITNGTYTFVKYHYPCGAIEWSAPAIFEGKFRDDYEDYPVAGYNAGGGGEPETRYPSLDGSGSYFVKDLDDKVGNTGRQGEYFFRIEEREGDDASTMCNAWHDWQERELKSELDSAANQLPACPCTAFQITGRFKFDPTSMDRMCFISVNGITIDKNVTNGRVTADVHRTCCYFIDIGALNFFYSFLRVIYSARPDNVIMDNLAEQLCLEQSNSLDSLEKFYNVRPINFCVGFENDLIQRILLWGDPHVKTLDGTNYTFNGVGEYTLLKTDKNEFVLQARTEVVAQGGLNVATVFTVGVAKEAGTDTVEIRLKSGGGLEMYINGTLYTGYNSLTNVSKEIGGNLRVAKKTANCVEVFFKSGVGVEFCEAKGMMSLVVTLVPEYFNMTNGLLGTYNKDPSDDFTLPNGTALSSNLTSKQIHFDFGLNWQITAEQSLFTYGPNENVSTFMNKSFVPMFVEDIVFSDNATEQAAKQQCGSDVVCLFDAASTNDVSVGVNSKNVSIKLVEENKKLSNFPPKFTYVPRCIEVTLGQVAFVNVTAQDNNSFTFNVLKKPDGANFTFAGNQLNFTWNVTSSKRVKFSFLVTDELGASAVSTPCIKMCACRNGGQCVAPKLGDKYNNDSEFIYQGCACAAGWTGRFCESDIDACVLNGQPCFKGVKCTDQPAPANISGYTCGACPSGYSGNGIKCVDNNECRNSSLNNCAQNCTNTPGSFDCSCRPGFKLNSNKYSCDDINECVPTNDCMHQCNNTVGSYTCYCNDLFVLDANDGKNCTPIKACTGNDGCNQVCYSRGGNSMACDCYSGYKLGSDSKTCEDIDECNIPGVKCTQRCENSIGGYKCKCFSGYKLESDGFTCTDINECLDSKLFSCPGAFRVCKNTPGNYTCECQNGLFFINGTCRALKVGEKPPEPTIPPPRSPSPQERLNSVELQLANMKVDQYNVTVDQRFREETAQLMDDHCSQNRAACSITSKRRRRALNIFTADHVHLLPGFPREDNNLLRVVFYVLLPSVIPGGGVIPVATLLQVVNNSKSDLEALFGVRIVEIKLGVVPTTLPPSTQNNTSTTTQAPTQISTVGTIGEDSNDDWKWIVIGVVIGVVVIICVVIVVCAVIKKKKQGKVGITSGGPEMPNNAGENDENANRGNENHEMVIRHGALPGEPLV